MRNLKIRHRHRLPLRLILLDGHHYRRHRLHLRLRNLYRVVDITGSPFAIHPIGIALVDLLAKGLVVIVHFLAEAAEALFGALAEFLVRLT